MSEWKEVELGDLIHIKHGWAFKGEFFAEEGDLIVVTPGNFLEEGGFRVRAGKEKFYTDDFPKEFLLKKDDLIIAMTEQGAGLLGSPALITEDNRFLHNQRIGLFQNFKKDQILKKYMYYLFFTQYIRGMISGSATGTKVKHTAPKRIYNIKVKLPSLPIQKKIAKVLSNYDDLIENNLKRIKLLEESARLTYEEWFLRFIIDGKKLEIDSETGLPFGWKFEQLGDFITFRKGKKVEELFEHYATELTKLLLLKSLSSQEYDYVKQERQVIVDRNDILMLMDGARSSAVFYAENGAVGSTLAWLKIKNIPKSYVYHYLDTRYELLEINNTGAAIPHANKSFINKMKIVMPSEDTFNSWNNNIEEINNEVYNLKDQNKLLKEARDILLPRLMTGMIDVDELEVAG